MGWGLLDRSSSVAGPGAVHGPLAGALRRRPEQRSPLGQPAAVRCVARPSTRPCPDPYCSAAMPVAAAAHWREPVATAGCRFKLPAQRST